MADGIIGTIPSIIQLAVELLLVFLTLFYYSPMLAMFALLVAPVAALSSWWLGKKLRKLQVKVQESEAAYRSFLQESLANLLIVKAFANEDYSTERLTQLREERFHWVYRRTKMGVASSTVMSLAFQTGYIVAFCYGAISDFPQDDHLRNHVGIFDTGEPCAGTGHGACTIRFPRLVSILASAGRIMELQQIPLEMKTDTQIPSAQVGVEIKDMTFGYTDETVLENVNLRIEPGEFVAIIGESGIGKTTLIRIIMSFMSNIRGSVTFFNEKRGSGAGECRYPEIYILCTPGEYIVQRYGAGEYPYGETGCNGGRNV